MYLVHRRGAEPQKEYPHRELTQRIIGAAIEVHRALGPGLLESAYEECLCYELSTAGIAFRRQVDVPVTYKDVKLDCGYRLDLLVEDKVILEIKCAEAILAIHEAQLLTYLKLTRVEIGLILNFHSEVLTRGGIVRKILSKPQALRASAALR